MKNYVSLHTHSDYSNRDGAQSVKQIVEKAARLNMPAVALTDHGMAGGLLQLKKECEKVGIKWIPGFEAYCAPTDHKLKEKAENHNKTSYHLTVLAKNYEGLKNIFRLSSLGWTEGYYYRPRISEELLKQYHEGLIILSGCAASRLSTFILEDRFNEAREHLKFMRELFGSDFYIEVQNHGLDFQIPINAGAITLAEEFNIPIVGTQDSHYQEPEDAELHQHICKLAAGDLEFDSDQNWFKSRDEMAKMFVNQTNYLDQTIEIANKVNVEWDYSRTIWPVYPLPEGRIAEQELRELTYKGFNKLFPNPTQEYKDRLEEELEVIISMGFASYFLIVQDFANWCRDQGMATSSGRGSSAGSLACYCLGITEVDPIKYDLLFSRFLDPIRAEAGGLCDIDYDVNKERRQELIDYVANKYGRQNISQIGTYSVFKPRGSLRDFARTYGYDVSVGDKLAKMVPADIAGKQLKFDEVIEAEPKFLKVEEQDVVKLARKAEGLKKQIGVHPAGIVIADKPINELLPLFLGRGGEITSQFDMHDVEDIGLVKFDFLGLKNLTVIEKTINLIKKNQEVDINISKIEDGDPKAYELFHIGDLDGIFQFETSTGLRELCIQTKPNNIYDLSNLNALFRPGPIGQNMLQEYVERRNGKKFIYEIPQLEPILKETYNIIVFQEQIMRICTDIAGYTKAESASFRKIVGKKLVDKMITEHDKFVQGCINYSNIEEQKAEKLFKDIEDFSLYGFCAGHAVAYSFLSYRCAWLKAHYKNEFYTALLNTSESVDDLVKYTYSAREHGIPLVAPDVNISDIKFKLDNGAIVFGFSGIKGLGEKACEKLIEARSEGEFKELADLVKAKINKGTLTALAECGALESISDLSRNQIVEHIPDLIEYYNKLNNWEEQRQKRIIRDEEREEAIAQGIKPPRKLPKLKDKPVLKELGEAEILTKADRLRMEQKTLQIYLTGHPLDDYSKILTMAKYTINDIKEGSTNDREIVKIPAVLSSFTKKFSKAKKNYGTSIIEDHTGRLDVTIFSSVWPKVEQKLEEGEVFLVTCRINKEIQDDGPTIYRASMVDIEPISVPKEIQYLVYKLKDGTEVKFIPGVDANQSSWQQASAYIKNLKRMV